MHKKTIYLIIFFLLILFLVIIVIAIGSNPKITVINPTEGATYITTSIDLNWSINITPDWCAYSLDGGVNNTAICKGSKWVTAVDEYSCASSVTNCENAVDEDWETNATASSGSPIPFIYINRTIPSGVKSGNYSIKCYVDAVASFTAEAWDYSKNDWSGTAPDYTYIIENCMGASIINGTLPENYLNGTKLRYRFKVFVVGADKSYFFGDKIWLNISNPANTTLISLSEGSHNVTIWANDSLGNMGNSSLVSFSVLQYPQWWSNSTGGNFYQYNQTFLNITLTDNINLNCHTFSWNITGQWVNDTTSCFSETITNITIQYNKTIIENPTVTFFGWQIHFNDSYGNRNQTDIFTSKLLDEPVVMSQSGLDYYNQTTTRDSTLNISLKIEHNISQVFNYTLSNTSFTGSDNITIEINKTYLKIYNKTANYTEIKFKVDSNAGYGTYIFNITAVRSWYNPDEIFNFPVAITVRSQVALISFTDLTTWTELGYDNVAYTKVVKLNNSGSYNATFCSLKIAWSPLNDKLTINNTNFNVSNGTITEILATISSPTADTYSTNMRADCIGTSQGDVVTTTPNNINMSWGISPYTAPSAPPPSGGVSRPPVVEEKINITELLLGVCGNKICEQDYGEDFRNCPQDCYSFWESELGLEYYICNPFRKDKPCFWLQAIAINLAIIFLLLGSLFIGIIYPKYQRGELKFFQ